MSDDNKLPEPVNIDDTFGLCPECGRYSDCLNVGRSHWFYCHIHKTKWLIGANLVSGWRDEDEAIWGANNKRLGEHREVHPVFLEHPAGPAKLATASVNDDDTISTNAALGAESPSAGDGAKHAFTGILAPIGPAWPASGTRAGS